MGPKGDKIKKNKKIFGAFPFFSFGGKITPPPPRLIFDFFLNQGGGIRFFPSSNSSPCGGVYPCGGC